MPYLTPQALPESDDCRSLSIPADTEWLALFGGALTELLFTWNWEQSEGGITVSETIGVIQPIIDAWYASQCGCELPDGDAIIRIDENGNYQQLIDGTWQDPQGDYAIPPTPAREEPTAQERRCAAAANAANVLELLYEDVTDSFSDQIGYAAAIFELSLTIGVLLAPPLGLAARSFLAIFTIVFRELFDLSAFITADTWTSGFTEKLTCLLLNNVQDVDGVEYFNYDNVIGDLLRNADVYDFEGSDLLLAGQVIYLLNIIGRQGLDAAGATTGVGAPDCDLCDQWVRCEDFSVSAWSWAAVNVDSWGDRATYSGGWNAVLNDTRPVFNDRASFLNIVKTLPAATYRRIEVDVYLQFGSSSVGVLSWGWTLDGAAAASTTYSALQTLVWEGTWDGGVMNLGAPIAYAGSPPLANYGEGQVRAIRYYGTGDEPDIGVSCD